MANPATPLGPGSIGLPGTDPARRELIRRGQLSFRTPSNSNLSLAEGQADVTVPSGTKQGNITVTHNIAWKSYGRVWVTIQDVDNIANGERPVSCQVRTVTANSFRIDVDTGAAVAADRTVTVAWLASGILP